MQGTIDTDEEEIVADNRNSCLRILCPINDSPYMISQDSKFKTRWDILIILLALFAVFLTPVQVAFDPPNLDTNTYKAITWIIDVLFGLDVLISIRTTIVDEISKVEIKDAREIAKRYILRGRFIIDVISSIPFDALIGTHSDKLKLISILKLARIFRFTRIISFLNATEDFKLSLKLFKLIFYLVIYLHLQACAWFFYTNLDKEWFPLTDIIQQYKDFYDKPTYYTYCFSVWHSTSIMAGADMVPANAHQAIATSILLLSSSFIDGSILGTISVILQSLNRKGTRLQDQIEFATSTMKNIKLSPEIQQAITEYLTVKQHDLDSQEELESLMKVISPSLRHIVTQHLFYNIVNKIKVFEDIPEAIEFVVQNIEVQVYQPEEYIIKQGQKAQFIYFLAQGECEVLVKDETKKDSFVRDIFPGGMFGEVSLLYNTKRTASIRSKGQCTVGALNDEQFTDLIQNYPEIEQRMQYQARQYDDHWKLFQISSISQVDYLHHLPYSIREDIHYRLQVENYEKGAKIFTRGQECEFIYFLIRGEIELVVDRNNQDHQLDVLSSGSFVGSYSIINETPFKFTGKAKTNLSLLSLSRENLFSLAEQSEHITDAIEEATQYIIDNEVPYCDYYQERGDFMKLNNSNNIQSMITEIAHQMKHQHSSASSHQHHTQVKSNTVSSLSKPQQLRGLAAQVLINPLREHRSHIQMRRRFKNSVRRLIVLNKGKETKKIKIIELINFIRAQKKKQSETISGLLEAPQPAPIPQRRQSNSQQFGFQSIPGRKQSNATIRKNSALAFNFLGDHQAQQYDQSDELIKINKKLDKMMNIMKYQQIDISHIKQSLNLKSSVTSPVIERMEPHFEVRSSMNSPPKVQIQTQMTGILEEDAENSYQSSASVSVGSQQNKGVSPSFTNEGKDSLGSNDSIIPDLNILAFSQTKVQSPPPRVSVLQHNDMNKSSNKSIVQEKKMSMTQLNKLIKSPQDKSNDIVSKKYSSALLSQVSGEISNQPSTGNINQQKPTPMRLMVERFIQSKVQTSYQDDHFSALREAINLAKQNNLIESSSHKKKNDSSLMSNSLSQSSQKSLELVTAPYMPQKKSQAPLPTPPNIKPPIPTTKPALQPPVSPIVEVQKVQESSNPPLVKKPTLTYEQITQKQQLNKQQNQQNNNTVVEKKINTQYVHQVMNLIKTKQQLLNSQLAEHMQQQQPPTFANIKTENHEESANLSQSVSNSVIPAQESRNFIINQASRYNMKTTQQQEINQNQQQDKNYSNLTHNNSSNAQNNTVVNAPQEKGRGYASIGREQLSVDNSAFELSNGNLRNNFGGSRVSEITNTIGAGNNRNGGTRIEDISGVSRIFNTSNTGDMNLLLGSGIPQIEQVPVQTEFFNPIMQVDQRSQNNAHVSKLKLITNREAPIPEFRDSMSPVRNNKLEASLLQQKQQADDAHMRRQSIALIEPAFKPGEIIDSPYQENGTQAQQLTKSKENLPKVRPPPRMQMSNDSLILQQELARMNYKKSSKNLQHLFGSNIQQRALPESREGELDELIEQEIERMEDDEN